MKRFIYKRSVLNIGILIWFALGIIFLIEHAEDIGSEQGQGMSIILIWIGLTTISIVLDLLLQYFIENRKLVNIIETVLLIGFIFVLKSTVIN